MVQDAFVFRASQAASKLLEAKPSRLLSVRKELINGRTLSLPEFHPLLNDPCHGTNTPFNRD
jgi:hypothetical protein